MMGEVLLLPPGVALAILAFILSLVPAGIFLWIWYLRRHDRPVPIAAVVMGLIAGALIVIPAFYLERKAGELWEVYSPATAHYFHGAVLPLQSLFDVAMPAVGTFFIVATIEEGLRFLLLYVWFRRSRAVDQVFDGIVIGLATGLGFATIENSIYFWNLFTEGSFDTLVFVFFLRFLISTLAHISFGGMMGMGIARGMFNFLPFGYIVAQGFLLPWFLHGLFDLFLGINLTFYAVILLLPPLLALVLWTSRRDFFVISRLNGRILAAQQAPETSDAKVLQSFFKQFDSPWNTHAPWLREKRMRRTLLHKLEHYE